LVLGGKAVSTVKNTIMEFDEQRAKSLDEDFMTRSDHAYTLLQAISFSPPISSKLRKIYQSIQAEEFNRDVIKERGFTLDNPLWSVIGNVIEGVTNVPLGRLANKMLNVDNSLDSRHETWKRIALIMGWNTWDLGIKDPDLVALGQDIKERKKQERKMEKVKEKIQKEKEKYPDKSEKEIKQELEAKEKYFPLSKKEQVDLLKDLGLEDKDIKELKTEQERANKIQELSKDEDNKKKIDKVLIESKKVTSSVKPQSKPKKKDKPKLSKKEQRVKDLKDLNAAQQKNILLELGYPSRSVENLKYESNRIEKIIELQDKGGYKKPVRKRRK